MWSFCFSWTTCCLWNRLLSDVRGCSRKIGVPDTYLHSHWNTQLQPRPGGPGVPWKTSNDGGTDSVQSIRKTLTQVDRWEKKFWNLCPRRQEGILFVCNVYDLVLHFFGRASRVVWWTRESSLSDSSSSLEDPPPYALSSPHAKAAFSSSPRCERNVKYLIFQSIAASIKEQREKQLHSRNSSTGSAASLEVATINSTADHGDSAEKPDENKNINGKVSSGTPEKPNFVSVPLGKHIILVPFCVPSCLLICLSEIL